MCGPPAARCGSFVDTLWRDPGAAGELTRKRSLMMPAADDRTRTAGGDAGDLGLLFHRLNNQLGIILANAELLEAKSADEMARARAAQVVASVLDAMTTAREIRLRFRRRQTQPVRRRRSDPVPAAPHCQNIGQ